MKICALNTHGLKGNLSYVEKLYNECDIVFISEHWLFNHEKIICDALGSKNVYFHSSMDDSHTVGRPYGGLC